MPKALSRSSSHKHFKAGYLLKGMTDEQIEFLILKNEIDFEKIISKPLKKELLKLDKDLEEIKDLF